MKKVIFYLCPLLLITAVFMVSCNSGNQSTDATNVSQQNIDKPAEKPVQLEPIDSLRVTQIAAMLPEKPRGFGENIHNRDAWEKLKKEEAYQNVIKSAEELLGKPFPLWNDEAYLTYYTKGTRPEGEKMLRDRSGWLAPLVIAECLENQGRFTPVIEMVFKELIKQKSWTLPAHDRGKQNFEGRNFTVDLNVANFGNSVAQALWLLDDKLNPAVHKAVLDALYARMFTPVMRTIETKNGDHSWLTGTNNWNAVCLAGVTGAALASIPDRKERAKFVAIGERYSRNSVVGFADDGYCSEGLGYFAYGFGSYIVLREAVLQSTKGGIDLFADEKMKKIGAYAPNMEILNNIYPSIADCRVGTKAPADILWYCSRNLGLGLEKYDTLTVKGSAGNLVSGLMYAFPNSASLSEPVPGKTDTKGSIRSYFDVAGVLIVRPAPGSAATMAAALKGGHNNEHHNHNDVGSYTVVVGDELLMGDPGGPFMYRSNTFGPERYTAYKNLASYGHPVPLVAGKEQSPGRDKEAKILITNFTDKKDLFVMDIASAYEVPDLKLVRSFSYDRRGSGSLSVKDEFSFTKPEVFETALITRVDCKVIGKDQLEFSGKSNKMIATIYAPGAYDVTFEEIEQDYPKFIRVAIKLRDPLQAGVVNIVFKPVRKL